MDSLSQQDEGLPFHLIKTRSGIAFVTVTKMGGFFSVEGIEKNKAVLSKNVSDGSRFLEIQGFEKTVGVERLQSSDVRT